MRQAFRERSNIEAGGAAHGTRSIGNATESGWCAFLAAADRIEALVEGETAALRARQRVDFADTSRRKRQGFLELSRTLPQLLSGKRREAVRRRLDQLGSKLERNRSALDVQLRAVREITEIIERTLKDAESDGTYSYASARQ